MLRMAGRTVVWLLVGGGVAGAIDITYAIVFSWLRRGVPASRVLQSVASGLLGQPAYDGGWATAALGLALHFLIAYTAAAIYFIASRWLGVLTRRAWVCGVLYGAWIYAFMNLVVIPLSRFPTTPAYPPVVLVTGLLVHTLGIGVPMALAARQAADR